MSVVGRLRSIRASALLLVSALAAVPAASEEPPPLAPMPAECLAASPEKPVFVPLPHLVEAMTARRRIVALAIGSSVLGNDFRNGDYYGLVDGFLESAFKGVDVEIVQRGVSGELARDAAERIRLDVARFSPDVVFWQVGTADGLAGIDPDEVGATVRDTVRWLAGHRVDAVLIGLHYTPSLRDDPRYQAVRRAVDEVARSENLLRVRRYEVGETLARLEAKRLVPTSPEDMVALDDACMAEYLARALATGLFGRRAPGDAKTP